ncbi:MAG: PASTA domain-containing protein [candidate division Zixibacteria bacterium]|nr:PASTA domain-containing protein [candidate division Zixibacteria bacterium]
MNQVRATRLSKDSRRKPGFLSGLLPYGTLKRKITLRAGLPLVILLVLYVVTDSFVMPLVTRHGTEFPLPDFTGQRLVEARMSLDDLNLRFEIASEEFAPGKEKGIILNQFPVAGTKVKSGRAIKFVVSLGEKRVPIPAVGGLSVRQAMLDLETAGLMLGEIAWAFSDTLPERVVVFSYPSAGTEIPLGSPVNLMVNRGRASTFTYMPKVIGLTLSEAIKRLVDKSLKLGITTYRTDENYLPETVLEQSEPEGAELDVSTEIDLVISTTE